MSTAYYNAESMILQRPLSVEKKALDVELDGEFQDLFRPYRFKVYHSGRGASKSWSIAMALVIKAHGGYMSDCLQCCAWNEEESKKWCPCKGTRRVLTGYRIGCFRELQNSIKDSVHRLIADRIEAMGLGKWFDITEKSIRSRASGSEFIFKGLKHNANEIKSTEGLDIVWVEEAQMVSRTSWEVLIPTIRKKGSEIWVSFNPEEETDDTYKRFVVHPPSFAFVKQVNWRTNPWFSAEMEAERLHMLKTDPEAYQHIWEGECRTISEAVIFKNKYVVDCFETPTDPPPDRFFHGLDFGFSGSPNAMTRSWITGKVPNEELWIDYESFSYQCDIDELPALLRAEIPTCTKWPIKADCARPESISYLRRQGFQISAAEKWAGCVEDRIQHLRGFKKIHIHQRCTHMRDEARLYRWKVDPVTKEILPVPVDKNNHGWDATGYALDGYIQRRGADKVWANL
jgi:phage terminase large subunit